MTTTQTTTNQIHFRARLSQIKLIFIVDFKNENYGLLIRFASLIIMADNSTIGMVVFAFGTDSIPVLLDEKPKDSFPARTCGLKDGMII